MPLESEKIMPVSIEEEMKSSYIDYSMSVITNRALPDVRDGMKPSNRRILVAMRDLNLAPGRPFDRVHVRSRQFALPALQHPGRWERTAGASVTRRQPPDR